MTVLVMAIVLVVAVVPVVMMVVSIAMLVHSDDDAAALHAFPGGGEAVDAERTPGVHHRELVGAGVDQRAEHHVAGDAGEAVEPRRFASSTAASGRSAQRRAEAVVDADHGDAAGARGVHRQQRGDAVEPGAVADARRHGDDRARR